nr:hypothetical protein [Succinivibrio sp.]
VTVVAGYETLKVDFKETDQSVSEGNYKDYTVRKVPVLVNYALNDNFNIWTEAQFDANSSNVKNVDDERIVPDKTLFAIGARYNF